MDGDLLWLIAEDVLWTVAGGAAVKYGLAAAVVLMKPKLIRRFIKDESGGNPVSPYDVGPFNSLRNRSRSHDDLDIHHAPQKHPADQVISGYDKNTAPAIALPKDEHASILNRKGGYSGTPRDLLAQDIRNLRNNTGAPNSALQELIDLSKRKYPEIR